MNRMSSRTFLVYFYQTLITMHLNYLKKEMNDVCR